MIIDRKKLLAAALVSALLLAALAFVANFTFPDLSRAQPAWLAAIALAHLLMISGRGLALRALAPAGERGGAMRWVQLAARHQLVFSVIPAGIGDAGFPYLAKRTVGLDAPVALRVLAQFRLRDAMLVAMMGVAGLMLVGLPRAYGMLTLALAIPLLWFSDDLAVFALRRLGALAPASRLVQLLRTAATHDRPSAGDRLFRTALAMLIWSLSIAAVTAAFRCVGVRIGIGEAMLFIAAVNIAGAVSLSIAGLGVSEAGGAAALVAAGSSVEQASSLALVVRPLLLLSVIVTSATLNFAIAAIRWRQAPASTP